MKRIQLPQNTVRFLTVLVLVAIAGQALSRPAFRPQPPLPVVSYVDVERYTGLWYEIARYPTFFEINCAGVTAEYGLREDGLLSVTNVCHKGSVDGPEQRIEGTAAVADPNTNAKLSVSFAPTPIEASSYQVGDDVPYRVGNYWIILLDEEYGYAVVGDPTRSYLWILSRTSTLSPETLATIEAFLPTVGYDPEKLYYTEQ